MKTLGVILARAGSKGLPDKNILPVAGRPMLVWKIEHALRSRGLNATAVSTDSDVAAEIAAQNNTFVVDRPAELASDTATVDSAARHAVEQIERQQAVGFEAIVILYGNVPVRPVDLIDRAVIKLRATECDSVQSVCPVGKMHPYWMKRLRGEQGDALEAYQPNRVYRRQDLPPVYMLDGGVIAVRRESLFAESPDKPHAFLGSDQRAVVTEPGQVVDVDTAVDLRVAEAILGGGVSSGPGGASA